MAAARAPRSPTLPLLLLLLSCVRSFAAHAEEPPVAEPPAAAEPADGCEGEVPADAEGIDAVRAGLHRGVCSTARYVDRLFGRENQFSEYEDDTNGRASVTLGWDEQDHNWPAHWYWPGWVISPVWMAEW
jgi:hypothetical protein